MSNVTTQDLIDDNQGLEGYRRYCSHVYGSIDEIATVKSIRTIRYRGAEFTCEHLSKTVDIYSSWRNSRLISEFGRERALHEKAKMALKYKEQSIRYPYVRSTYRRVKSQIGIIHDHISRMGKRTGEYFYPKGVKVSEFRAIEPQSTCLLCRDKCSTRTLQYHEYILYLCEFCYMMVKMSTPDEQEDFIGRHYKMEKDQLDSDCIITLTEVNTDELRGR